MAVNVPCNICYSGEVDEEQLIKATTSGEFEKVLQLLKAGVSPDSEEYNKSLFYISKNFMTPLQIAAKNGFVEIIDLLISYGADVNAKNCFDVTALHVAAENGHVNCVKSLLKANAASSMPTKFSKFSNCTAFPYPSGTTPLHLAASNNHVDCVYELIQYGADYNAIDEFGRTSLYIAAKLGYEQCILSHLKNAFGRNILSLPDFQTSDTPLHFAVSRGYVECVDLLIKCGSDVSHKNSTGSSPLHLAVSPMLKNDLTILKMLILEGYNADINQLDGHYCTPLHFVCFKPKDLGLYTRRPDMAKFLISYGANVNIRDYQYVPLIEWEVRMAESGEDPEVVKYIARSMGSLPSYKEFKIYCFTALEDDTTGETQERRLNLTRGTNDQSISKITVQKWYETLASNPRTLQHYCRFTIRKAIGPRTMKGIHKLRIPNKLKSYLLLEYGD